MRLGVLLFNLGGPERLEDVRPFLFNLFSDPEIIRIKSYLLRRTLAWFIATARQGKSRDLYRQIGGGSPLRNITEAQAGALSSALESRNLKAQVYVGMRCWNPSIEESVRRILEDGITRLVLLPLFPQYSLTTTGSCLKHFESLDRKFGISSRVKVSVIRDWYDEPLYVQSMAALIRETVNSLPPEHRGGVHLLYSAHSIPVSYVEEGDPYLEQTKRSVELINSALQNAFPSTLAFQSKVGPVKWLGPDTKQVLQELGRKGCRAVAAVPVSFVSDHIETLQEMDILYRDLAAKSGIEEFRRVQAPNVDPGFINALAHIVEKAATG